MNKSYIISGLLLLATLALQAQDTLFVCNFESGLPESFATYDRDGNEPSRSMKRYGLEVGKAWVSYAESETNNVAVSGSWYKEVSQSDDWLVTPAIHVADVRAILSWRACALDSEHPDGYKVYISDKGNRPEDFTDEPVFAVDAESAVWKEHFLSLEAYAGKNVYVAFVNNSINCNLLMLDDVTVQTREHTFLFTNLTPEAVTSEGGVKVTGTITSSGFLPVDGYKLVLTYGEKSYTVDRSGESIAPDSLVTVTFDAEINVSLNTTEDYTLVISSMDGTDVQTIEGSITCFERTVLIEEGTGTWCMWCPRGQFYLKELHKKRSGEFVDIAVHVSDEMMVADYAMSLYVPFFGVNGLPSCVMDRNKDLLNDLGSLEKIETMLDKARAKGTIGRISDFSPVSATRIDLPLEKLSIDVACEFGKAIAEDAYRLAFVLVEDEVTGYAQANGYSGSSMAMGGFDLLPDPIPAGEYVFANVARAVLVGEDMNGKSLTLSATPKRHTAIYNSYEFDLKDVFEKCNLENCKVVGLIIDNQTGEVVNAIERSLSVAYGIDEMKASAPIRLQTNSIVASSPFRQVEVWSVNGQLLHQDTPESTHYVLPQMERGQAVVIRALTDDETATFKYMYK